MRLTWLSNSPWAATGYGNQTALITPRLNNNGHAVAVVSTYGHQGTPISWNGVTVFGAAHHPYGLDILHGHTDTWQADASLTLIDLQVMDVNSLLGTKWIAWCPLDHQTFPALIWANARNADVLIAMSKHASGELDKMGRKHHYIPCAVDTSVYKPAPQAQAREAMQLPQDRFIVGMVAMNKGNPSRKAFQQNITAFAALKKKYTDVMLYLHTGDGTRGVEPFDNLAYCKALGLSVGYHMRNTPQDMQADVMFANQYGLDSGTYSPDMMANLYNSFDVLTAVTMGEGFGVPIIESQACGTPVIVGDWTSMPELLKGGWLVEREDAEPFFTPLNSFHYMPHAGAIADKMEQAYKQRGNQLYKDNAVKGVREYDIERVMTKYWLPVLKEIEPQLKAQKHDALARNLDVLR